VTEEPLSSEEILAMLEESASRLLALTRDAPVERLNEEPESGELSARALAEIIGARAEVWRRWITQILTEDHPTFTFDFRAPEFHIRPDMYRARAVRYTSPSELPPEPGLDQELRAFSDHRRNFIETLSRLTADQWERSATVEVSGRPSSVRTVRWFASELARREQANLERIENRLNPEAGA
jgi:hypothetical protein